jgi:gamma-tubulin complex component 4
VDVVEVQFALLCERLNRSHDFEGVRFVHDQYLAALAQHCFLHSRV